MNLKKNFKEVVKMFEEMDLETIQSYKWILMVLIAADLFGLYWYLNLKKLAIAIMIVIVIFLSILLIQEKRRYEKMPEEKQEESEDEEEEKKEKKEKKKKTEYDESEKPVFGALPDPEEYNKRMEDAYGSF